jgi:thymidine kinase
MVQFFIFKKIDYLNYVFLENKLSSTITIKMSGYLELIFGPMFSGKTTYLINTYNQCTRKGNNVFVINYSEDTRYGDKMLSSHDQVMIPCVFSKTLYRALNTHDINSYDVVLINEGQFFEDLYESVIYLVESVNKTVYICGLDGDFKRQKFGTILDLVPLSDKITKLRSKCDYCTSPALFSHRITSEKEQVIIGVNNYVPLCRSCYVKENFKKTPLVDYEIALDVN